MTIVIDASVTLAFCFEDERTPEVMAIFDKLIEQGAVAPGLWRYEVANALLVAQRRGRFAAAFRRGIFDRLDETPIVMDEESDLVAWSTTIHLADLHRLTVYDAAYLELAQRRRLPLATLDAALTRAARAAGVDVLA